MPRMYIIYIYIIIKYMQHYFYKKKNWLCVYTINIITSPRHCNNFLSTLADRFFNIRFFFCNIPSIVYVYVLGGIRASFGPFVRSRLLLFSVMCVCVCDPWPRQNLTGRFRMYIYLLPTKIGRLYAREEAANNIKKKKNTIKEPAEKE